MRRVSKGFYLSSVAVGVGVSQVIADLWLRDAGFDSALQLVILVGLALSASLYATVVILVLWYKMWAAIQDGHARTTPGKAIGFLFIPLFNVYWVFQATWGFSRDYNKYVERHGITTERLSEGLFLAYCVCSLVAGLLTLTQVFTLMPTVVAYYILLVITSRICDAINAIVEEPAQRTACPQHGPLFSGVEPRDGTVDQMKKLSKGFYLGSVAMGVGVSQVSYVLAELQLRDEGLALALQPAVLHGLALISGLYGAIVSLVLWYKIWAAIQDGHARTTPGKAIGFLFIPVFNIYWVFQAVWGLAKDYNKYVERHRIATERLPEGLFLACVILGLATWIPVIGLTLIPVHYFVLLVITSEICDAINTIAGVPVKRTGVLRLAIRCSAMQVAVILAVGVLPWSWASLVLPSLSPHVLVCSAIAARSIGVATLVGLPVLAMLLIRRRWFCRYACPVGLAAEYVGRIHSSGKSRIKRLPSVGRWIVLVTLGGACLGYPLFLWLDPLAIFHGIFTLCRDPLSLAGQVSAVALAVILSISLLVPGAWCLRICPLGATQDLLALPRRWFRRKDSPTPAAGNPTLSRRSALSAALGAACVRLGAGWGIVASNPPAGNRSKPLRPPGSIDEQRFAGLCIRCGNCIRACPTGIIQPDLGSTGIAGFLAPVVRFQDGYCREDCHACTQVCPSGAITRLSLEQKPRTPMGVAKLDFSICLLRDNHECDICARVCRYEAIDIRWSEEEYLAIPHVDREKCPGCGACEVGCPGTNEWEREHSDEPIPLRRAIEVHPCD